MLNSSYSLGLNFKVTNEVRLACILGPDHLDSYFPVYARLVRTIYLSKAARADLVFQSISAYTMNCLSCNVQLAGADLFANGRGLLSGRHT